LEKGVKIAAALPSVLWMFKLGSNVGGGAKYYFPPDAAGTLVMSLRDGGSASATKPLWTIETATRPPTSNGEMLATRLIGILLVYCFAPFLILLSSPHKHY